MASSYVERLPADAKKRYHEKIIDVDGLDPYQIPNSSWSVDKNQLPDINHARIVQYFVLGKSAYTCEDFAAYKSLGAYRTFVCGWVREVRSYKPDGCQNTVVSAKVLHSQRLNERPLTPWLISNPEGFIISAHCDCMAGLGETCTHVAALAFAIDAYTQVREKVTCTGVPAYWKVPQGLKGVTPKPAYKIDFASARCRKEKLDMFISADTAQAPSIGQLKGLPHVLAPSQDSLNSFFAKLSLAPNKPNILNSVAANPDLGQQEGPELPSSLQNLYDPKCITMTKEELQQHCDKLFSSITITQKQSDLLEKKTRAQAKSSAWFLAKAGRVTASNMHAACHTKLSHPSASLVKKVCYPRRVQFSSIATQWGLQNEPKAKATYLRTVPQDHVNMTMRSCGLHVSPTYPFLGASPDAIIECDCHGKGCVEVKCPYSHRYHTIEQVLELEGRQFCLSRQDGHVILSKQHPYYSQVQTQLFLTGLAYCDFVVWTTVDVQILRVHPDQAFWDECVPKVTEFFRMAVLPELVARLSDSEHPQLDSSQTLGCVESQASFSTPQKRSLSLSPQKHHQDNEDEAVSAVYCFCRKPEFGRMVACDSDECRYQWFHFKCVDVKSKPKGKWFCSDCRPNQKVSQNEHKKVKI